MSFSVFWAGACHQQYPHEQENTHKFTLLYKRPVYYHYFLQAFSGPSRAIHFAYLASLAPWIRTGTLVVLTR